MRTLTALTVALSLSAGQAFAGPPHAPAAHAPAAHPHSSEAGTAHAAAETKAQEAKEKAAEVKDSTILSTDYSSEIANATKLQVQLQAGTSVLGITNQIPQDKLTIIQKF